MKNRLAALFSWALTLSSAIFPSQSYAVAVADRMAKDENPTKNEQKEIRWTKSLSKSYAKALISAQYENWSNSEYKALLKLWGKESNWDQASAIGLVNLISELSSVSVIVRVASSLSNDTTPQRPTFEKI